MTISDDVSFIIRSDAGRFPAKNIDLQGQVQGEERKEGGGAKGETILTLAWWQSFLSQERLSYADVLVGTGRGEEGNIPGGVIGEEGNIWGRREVAGEMRPMVRFFFYLEFCVRAGILC